ncbi:MAG: DUF4982 domain-containing protein [Oscillospiraceae bacterium]|nr:DUF4982 domain-containing protein [Oscillospiraceae bacterium]
MALYNMDLDWKFHRGEIERKGATSHSEAYGGCKAGGVMGPGGILYDDSNWRQVDLPHDFFAESGFSADNLISHGYRDRCNGWYRKTFRLPEELRGKHLLLVFEGTAVGAEFYFNGSLMARSFSAYTETAFVITDRANFGDRANILAVYIRGLETEGWWYEGAGIYRHVRLYAKDPVHIAHNGIFAKPMLKQGTKNSWVVQLQTQVENTCYEAMPVTVLAQLFDGERLVAQSISKEILCPDNQVSSVSQSFSVGRPVRWDVDDPKLYTLHVTVQSGKHTDTEQVNIGFRTFTADKDEGFFLNGKKIFLKGVCCHQDHAGVGVAVPDSVQEYRIRRLKEMGCNAYRCSHNLPNKEILDICDRLGMIVMDENRRFETREEVLEYLRVMVRRDRNHPCVMFWSLFNEEPLQNTAEGARIYRRMRAVVKQLDDSRLLTGAINGSMEGAGLEMDVTGVNYNLGAVEAMRSFHPDHVLFGSENNSAVTTRGCYRTDYSKNVLSNYDEECVLWGQTIRQTWDFVRSHPYFGGIFVWTGFDYRGEPSPFTWPTVSSSFGIMDTCGFAKDAFYFHKACFTQKPMIHLLPHWNHQKGDMIRVMAATNCEEAELFLNGRSLGRKAADVCDRPQWQVSFEPGTLLVKGYRGGKCVAKAKHTTTDKPCAVKIEPVCQTIKNDGHDTAILNVCVVDKKGRPVPTADNTIRFEVLGDGILRGVGNGDPNSHEKDDAPYRRLFAGLCQALVMSKPGAKAITVRAESDGLEPAEVTLEVVSTAQPNYILSCENNELSGFTMSELSKERPDPLVVLSDNDMNSFIPVRFQAEHYQVDFQRGWRIYRVVYPADGTYTLRFARVFAESFEVYAGSTLCCKKEHLRHEEVTCSFTAHGKTELRILICGKTDSPSGCGISGMIEIKKKDKV